jgi:hypothetical protein
MSHIDWNTFPVTYPEAYDTPEDQTDKNIGVENGKY